MYAALDANEALHGRAVAALVASAPPRILPPFVLAELDYLIATRVGHDAQLALLDEIARGVYQLDPFSAEDVGLAGASWIRYHEYARRPGGRVRGRARPSPPDARSALHGRAPLPNAQRTGR